MDARFIQYLGDSSQPIALDFCPPSTTLLIAFGGIIGALGIAPFEFFNITRNYPVHRVYVRDMCQSWYHGGLPGIANDALEIAAALKTIVGKSGATRLVTTGNSMGGYAAILFGALLDADEVHAFAPQTFIDPSNRQMYQDGRWPEAMIRVHRSGDQSLFDLRPVLHEHSGNSRFYVHYSPQDVLDECHAKHIRECVKVTLRVYPGGGHDLVRQLKASGDLERIIDLAVGTNITA